MQKLVCLLLLLLCKVGIAYAQGENNVWYLGFPLALNFNHDTPKLQAMHAAAGYGGGTSVCDANGELLFYTNGAGIFRKDHSLMPGTANFTNGKTADGHVRYFNQMYTLDSLIVVDNYLSTGIKIVQLDKNKARYHLFYMNYPDRDTLTSPLNLSNNRLLYLAYSIVDMSLNGGLGGIDPNYRNIVIDSQLTNSFDLMSNGQCGVWIVVNKKDVAYEPMSLQEDQGSLLSYLLQPDGNIVLVHSQPLFHPLPASNYNGNSSYPHVGIHFAENKQYLILSHGARQSFNFHGSSSKIITDNVGNAFTAVDVRAFNNKTGVSTTLMDSLLKIDTYQVQGTPIPVFEHDMYIAESKEWIYTFRLVKSSVLNDTLNAYPGQLLGNSTLMRQNVQKIDILVNKKSQHMLRLFVNKG